MKICLWILLSLSAFLGVLSFFSPSGEVVEAILHLNSGPVIVIAIFAAIGIAWLMEHSPIPKPGSIPRWMYNLAFGLTMTWVVLFFASAYVKSLTNTRHFIFVAFLVSFCAGVMARRGGVPVKKK